MEAIEEKYTNAVKTIKEAIQRSQYKAVMSVNREMLSLYYGIGNFVSKNSRNGYWGKGAIHMISEQLQKEMPGLTGYSESMIKYMRQFYEEWSSLIEAHQQIESEGIDEKHLLSQIRQPAVGEFDWAYFVQLPFTHHIQIFSLCKNLQERFYYITEAVKNAWNKYTLRDYIKSGLYSQHQPANNFKQTISSQKMAVKAVKAFKDNYLLQFINVEPLGEDDEDIDEAVLENEIVNNIRKFIEQFGDDFLFIRNQYRVMVEDEEYFIDLLFFNRDLNCLVAIELKTGKFKPAYLGQLSMYLSALDKSVKKEHENPSIGIILCKEAKKTVIEFALRDYSKPMTVSTYSTTKDMPENFKKALPNEEDLRKLL